MKCVKSTAIAAGIVLSLLACDQQSLKHGIQTSDIVLQNPLPPPPKQEELQNQFINGEEKDNEQLKKTPGVNYQQQPLIKSANPDWDKKIIRTATLNLEIKDFQKSGNLLREKTKQLGGYIAQEQQNQTDFKIENSITIKVPVERFDDALHFLSANANKIIEKQISSQDVSGEMIDTKSRLESKKQVRLRYLELLRQAKKMEDILQVEQEINSIQEEIESANARIKWLGHSASYSTINLTYFEILHPSVLTSEPGFDIALWQSFKSGWNWLKSIFISLVSVWPLFIIAVIAFLGFKKIRFRNIKATS